MGRFYITNSAFADNSASRVISRSGFKDCRKFVDDGITIAVFKKRRIDHTNYLQVNKKDFVAVNGTWVYKEEMGENALKLLWEEFDGTNIRDIRKNSIGHYVLMIKKDSRITIFCDKYALYDVFYHVDGDNFIISNSYFALLESMKVRKLNRMAFFEEVLNYGCIGRERMFKHTWKLFGNDVMRIDCSKNKMNLNLIEYDRGPKRFHKDFDVAIREYAERVNYVFSVIRKNFRNIAIELTGGLDTRTVISALNRSGAGYSICYGVSRNPVLSTDKEDLEIVVLFSQKYAKELYLMDWAWPPVPQKVPDDLFYNLDIGMDLVGYNGSHFEEFSRKMKRYPDLFLDGYFGETLKSRRWLEVQLFNKRTSLSKLVNNYFVYYDLSRLFKDKRVRERYTGFLVRKIRQTAVGDFHIPIKGNNIELDYFDEVRQLFSRTMDNGQLNFQNGFTFSMSPLGDLALYEPCFNLPFHFRRDERFQSQLIKLLDKSTLQLPVFTHQTYREVDKKYNVLAKKPSFKELMAHNFFKQSRICLEWALKITGKEHRNAAHLKKYRAVLKKDPIISKYFDVDKLENVNIMDNMYRYSVLLGRYYYPQFSSRLK